MGYGRRAQADGGADESMPPQFGITCLLWVKMRKPRNEHMSQQRGIRDLEPARERGNEHRAEQKRERPFEQNHAYVIAAASSAVSPWRARRTSGREIDRHKIFLPK
jgi:hypothetical protein